MKKKIGIWQFFGFAVTVFLGTLLHFLFDKTGWLWTTPISAVNESTAEHMKLFFFPAFLFAIVEALAWGKEKRGFWSIKLRGILLGLFLIPALFYTYNGAVGKSPDWLNVFIFFLSAALAFLYEARLLKNEDVRYRGNTLALLLLCILGALFVLFTYMPPQIPLFMDPNLGTYGIT